MLKVGNWAKRLLLDSRVAHLASSTKEGKPHVVPICFAYDMPSIYTPIDEKPKRTTPNRLRRVQNIMENPYVSLVVDHYEEDWTKLSYAIVTGSARMIQDANEHKRAVRLLRIKYPQYRSMSLEERPIIKISPLRITCWSGRRN